jgi:hypothetical protein
MRTDFYFPNGNEVRLFERAVARKLSTDGAITDGLRETAAATLLAAETSIT